MLATAEKYEPGALMGAKEQGADATQQRWMTVPRSLCFVLNGDDVLMLKRAAHRRIYPRQYNGLGGHIERDEDPASGALREVAEESGLQVHSLRLRAIYNIDAGHHTGILLFIYTALSDSRCFHGDCAEGELEWVPRQQLLQLDLVEDLPQLLPRILSMGDHAPPLHAHVSYDEHDRHMLRFCEEPGHGGG